MEIPFNKPYLTGNELSNIEEAHALGQLAGDGIFTKKCQNHIKRISSSQKALLTHSCTAALEMAALLLRIVPGDEVILPSYTFTSTANAFLLRGATPVFIDIRSDTLNLDECLIERAITSKTKAIIPVHYAGVACEMDQINDIAKSKNLFVVEDAAQGIFSSYKSKPLGSIGDLGTYSFHETKNVISGEGGALLINDPELNESAEILREKGTNRSSFFRGEIDKYTWQDYGSSYLPGEIVAAFLEAQLKDGLEITKRRMKSWYFYHNNLANLEVSGLVKRPYIPDECIHNAHMYYLVLNANINRAKVLAHLRENNIYSMFHYVPLHSSPAGTKFGRVEGDMAVTNFVSEQLIRLPLWVGISENEQTKVIETLIRAISIT